MTSNRLILPFVLSALGMPFLAHAVDVVVPPPMPPGSQTQAPPVILPPSETKGANPFQLAGEPKNTQAATSGADTVFDLALPDAPRAPKLLRPAAPKGLSSKAVIAPQEPPAPKKVQKHDPFAGVMGIPVSDSQINRFVFPEPVEGVFFQEGAPLPECPENAQDLDPCKPVFLNGKRMMLLQLRAGAKGPVQMLAHLASGKMETLNLMPAAGPGAVIRIGGAEDGPSDSRLAKAATQAPVDGTNPSEAQVALLSRFASGDIPAGYEPVKVGKPVRFEVFEVHPMASWTDGANIRVHLHKVLAYSDAPVAISPALFRHENVKALALDKETITATDGALLYMVEQVPSEIE